MNTGRQWNLLALLGGAFILLAPVTALAQGPTGGNPAYPHPHYPTNEVVDGYLSQLNARPKQPPQGDFIDPGTPSPCWEQMPIPDQIHEAPLELNPCGPDWTSMNGAMATGSGKAQAEAYSYGHHVVGYFLAYDACPGQALSASNLATGMVQQVWTCVDACGSVSVQLETDGFCAIDQIRGTSRGSIDSWIEWRSNISPVFRAQLSLANDPRSTGSRTTTTTTNTSASNTLSGSGQVGGGSFSPISGGASYSRNWGSSNGTTAITTTSTVQSGGRAKASWSHSRTWSRDKINLFCFQIQGHVHVSGFADGGNTAADGSGVDQDFAEVRGQMFGWMSAVITLSQTNTFPCDPEDGESSLNCTGTTGN